MGDSPTTRSSLLVRIRNGQDHEAWNRFVDVYGPPIYGFARKYGFQDADAADLMQEVLRAVAGAAERLEYDPQRGSFRGWLFTVVRNKIRNFLASPGREIRGTGGTDAQALLAELPARANEHQKQWDLEYDQRLFTWAAEQVRREFEEKTWKAFWQTAVEGKNAKQVSQHLEISVGAVYIAKSRVLSRLKEQIKELQIE
jgi:RNA polymerase sigma factor (sigma-70 family)